eukprot:7281357-Alexandrium_andersonii.AAC.1
MLKKCPRSSGAGSNEQSGCQGMEHNMASFTRSGSFPRATTASAAAITEGNISKPATLSSAP